MTAVRGVKVPQGPLATLDLDMEMICKAVRKHPARAAAFGRIVGTLGAMHSATERVMRSQEAALATSGALQARLEVVQAALVRSNDERDALAAQVARQKDLLTAARDGVKPSKRSRRNGA